MEFGDAAVVGASVAAEIIMLHRHLVEAVDGPEDVPQSVQVLFHLFTFHIHTRLQGRRSMIAHVLSSISSRYSDIWKILLHNVQRNTTDFQPATSLSSPEHSLQVMFMVRPLIKIPLYYTIPVWSCYISSMMI
jgi:hypothetical protein